MNTRHLIQKIGIAGAVALAAASCTQDDLTGGRGTNGNAIGFGITTLAENTAEGRASEADDKPIVLPFPGGRDTLYLHPWAEENRSVPSAPQKGETRGVPVTTEEDFKDVCGSFGVTAYTDDGRLFMPNEEVTSASGNLWTTGETYFWPAEETLNFYAYAPYSSTGDGYGDNMTINQNAKTITFSHTVPDQATKQPDILFTHKACSKASSENGTVPLRFHHALAGVKFVAKNVTNCTVTSITLRGLYGQGLCTYTYDGDTGTFAWTTTGDKRDFSETFNVTLNNSEGENTQPITDEKPETTFMMIPQTLEGVTVEVTLVETASGESFTLTGSLAQTGTWEAGKIYTYAISTESINWEYVFEVTPSPSITLPPGTTTPSITLPLGTTTGQYTVTSYRQRKGGDPSTREAVAWKAENTSFSETDPEKGEVETTLKDILLDFTYQDENPSETKSYPIEVTTTTLRTTHPGDQTLKENTQRGSADSPYDLSTHDENGSVIPRTTANCYVVSAAGTYQLPLVYGNAIKNGSENSAAYQGGNFKDYQNNTINNSRINGANNAVLVWSDGFFMFKDIHLDAAKKNLVFTIDSNYMQQANAVLAVRDASNRIMWSWHIWVTERPVYTDRHILQDLRNSSNTYELMQCNLGWVDGKKVYYNSRKLTFSFTQAGSGKTAELIVRQEGETFDYKDVGSTYYQWGRKDPLVALKNWDSYRYEDYRLHETGDPDYVYRYQTGPTTIGNAIQHPNVFYTRGTTGGADWNDDHTTTLWNADANGGTLESTTSVKTIYDPSPRGFKVPMPRAFAIFVNGNTGDGSTSSGKGELNGHIYEDDVHNKYRVFPKANKQGEEIHLTATGQRADISGLPVYEENGDDKAEVGGLWSLYGVYYWTCVPKNTTSANTLVIRKDHPSVVEVYSFGFSGTKTMARPVRPIADR